jgi:hypothetical protein
LASDHIPPILRYQGFFERHIATVHYRKSVAVARSPALKPVNARAAFGRAEGMLPRALTH